jgi:hypothetical protein
VDVKALLRLAVLYNVPIACNRATADFLISSPLMRDYQRYRDVRRGYASGEGLPGWLRARRPGPDGEGPEGAGEGPEGAGAHPGTGEGTPGDRDGGGRQRAALPAGAPARDTQDPGVRS